MTQSGNYWIHPRMFDMPFRKSSRFSSSCDWLLLCWWLG